MYFLYDLNEISVQKYVEICQKKNEYDNIQLLYAFLIHICKNVVDYIAVGNRCHPTTFILSQMILKIMSSHKSRKINKG